MAMSSESEVQILIEKYKRLEKIVDDRLHKILMTKDNPLLLITHRIKTVDSIKGKLARKSDHYTDIHGLRDILGVRVICYFLEDIDRTAKLIAENFRVDWKNSKDKRELIDARSFGYLSLHYICALPEEEGELSNLWFEIQIRTILQHSWAEIEHDLGYKAEIEIPRDIRRSFSRAASLLETTDLLFADIKKKLMEYKANVEKDMKRKRLDHIYFDALTLAEFTSHNETYLNILNEIASITNAHITENNPKNLLSSIDFLGIDTLQKLTNLLNERHDLILKLARDSLQDSGLDELASTVVYYYFFRAELISGDYSMERIHEFFMLTAKNEKSADKNTERILKARKAWKGQA